MDLLYAHNPAEHDLSEIQNPASEILVYNMRWENSEDILIIDGLNK